MAPLRPVLGLIIGTLLLSSSPCSAATYPPLHLPAFALGELQAPNAATLKRVGDAISSLGMFAVTSAHTEDVSHNALSAFVACAQRGGIELRQVEMEDGAVRHTLATATNGSSAQPLPADALRRCPDFAAAAYRLRAAVAAAGAAYAGVLDAALYGEAACATPATCFRDAVAGAEGLEHFHMFTPSPSSAPKRATSSLDAASAAASDASAAADGRMLAMHSDIGLFLVMSPAELFDTSAATAAAAATAASSSAATAGRHSIIAAPGGGGDGKTPQRSNDLVVQLADGRIVAPVLPDGALLVMNGEGLSRWMRVPASSSALGGSQPYSPLHEVLSSDMAGGVRAWFGRMFMPPASAVLQVTDEPVAAVAVAAVSSRSSGTDGGDAARTPHISSFATAAATVTTKMTFGEYRQHTYRMFHDGQGHAASAVGCSPTRRLLADEGSCGANEVYCWHSCMPMPANATCGKAEILCQNVNNGLLWPQNYTTPGVARPGHCKDCTLICPAKTAAAADNSTVLPPSASSFCNTNLGATTMWMSGFQFAKGHERGPCVVYLFPEWVLDSAGKFAGACIGTFLMGVLVGALGYTRGKLKDSWVAQGLWEQDYSPQWRTWLADAAIVSIIAVQVCLGYWLMLVAMTYQAELFIMVVLGLACGHVMQRPRPLWGPAGRSGAAGKSGQSGSSYEQEKLEPCCPP
ncbi:hypothetical protein GPECTOR_31g375 [Gonium pectorale]|uniref:4Fe-4S ferredoxin-type domain-containing protein n=1 Tax=Gonium pectorale TaxID=33097 RepID=A0A150GDT7_GONPE|nr:hypothetical protein GPECTOR_31g375 [Gonium pectorale]|eukprot:KXZ48011.1 hypothetical protein GPECTOR_31g375 [Gonium pectorale]